jgi:hypothetical protein
LHRFLSKPFGSFFYKTVMEAYPSVKGCIQKGIRSHHICEICTIASNGGYKDIHHMAAAASGMAAFCAPAA